MFQNFMGFQQSIVENGHRFAMLGAASLHNKLSYVQENMGGLSAIASFAPYITQQDEMITNQLTKVKDFYSNLNKGKDEMLFISNHKLSSEQLDDIRKINFNKTGDSNVSLDFNPSFSKVALPLNTQVNFSALSLDAPIYDAKESPKYVILSSLLRNEFLHKKVREQGGAYGGGAAYDPFSGTFKMFS